MTERMKRREMRRAVRNIKKGKDYSVYGSTAPNQPVAFFDWFAVFRSLFK